MKRLIAIAVVLTAIVASQSFAQTTAVANVNLTVNTALAITATQSNLNLGSAAAGTTDSLYFTGANAAEFTVTGTSATNFSLGWVGSTLNNGSWHLTPRFYLGGLATETQASATPIVQNQSFTSSGSGNYYFWAGAAVDIPANAAGGAYTGTLTLTITVN